MTVKKEEFMKDENSPSSHSVQNPTYLIQSSKNGTSADEGAKADDYLLCIEVSGISKNQIQMEVIDNQLVVARHHKPKTQTTQPRKKCLILITGPPSS